MQSGSETGVPRCLSKCYLHLPDCSFILPSLIPTSNSNSEKASEKPRLLTKQHQRSPASLHPPTHAHPYSGASYWWSG